MKFDCIIENPPYAGSFHLDFLKESLKMLDEKGKFTIIEPATWLINIRKNGNAKLYDEINELFMFTPDEIAFMDKTLKKFERHSPWFKRYMCGKDSVTSEEVQKFIDSIFFY